MDVVLIPAFNRPEMLYLCLTHIVKARHYNEHYYLLCLDYGHDPACEDVFNQFGLHGGVIKMPHPRNRVTKQSANVLNAWCAGAAQSTGLVYLIEDDVLINEDYFHFHRSVNQFGWCSIGAVNFNDRRELSMHTDEYYISRGVYQSIGVCFCRDVILQDIRNHYNQSYIDFPSQYLARQFPYSKIGTSFIEQDGLIHRISEQGDKAVIFPMHPRCFHAGLYGKNRGRYQSGTLQERIDFVKSVVYSEEELRKHVSDEYFIYDSKPQPNTHYYGHYKEV